METQSMHAVIYNDDLLIEILLLLSVISIFRFKSVCKRWLSLISDPTFILGRSQIHTFDPPSGVLMPYRTSSGYDLLSFDTRIPYKISKLKNPFTFGHTELQNATILQSCNGFLLLCCKNTMDNEYWVYNPCVNLLKMVPQCPNKEFYSSRIAFDPTKSPHYKVIHAVLVDHDNYTEIHTYSSESKIWSVCSGRYQRYKFNKFSDGIYWNDALYWYNGWDDPLLCKLDFNIEHQSLTTIKNPRALDGDLYRDLKLFETCGCLLLVSRKYNYPLLMDIYEMWKGYSEWLVKYHVNLNDEFSDPRRSWICTSVISICLGEREEDSYILIKQYLKIFQYKPFMSSMIWNQLTIFL